MTTTFRIISYRGVGEHDYEPNPDLEPFVFPNLITALVWVATKYGEELFQAWAEELVCGNIVWLKDDEGFAIEEGEPLGAPSKVEAMKRKLAEEKLAITQRSLPFPLEPGVRRSGWTDIGGHLVHVNRSDPSDDADF